MITRRLLLAFLAVLLAACGGGEAGAPDPAPTTTSTSSSTPPSTTTVPVDEPESGAVPPPDWLGTRVLPPGENGLGEIQPTPPELVDRRFETVDVLPPPTKPGFEANIGPVPDDVIARSTWSDSCPVARDDLRYVTLPFWGFDERRHTGELLLHADAVAAVVAGFERLHDRRFPIEEMRVVTLEELDAPPTGDGNNTSAFVCRPAVGSSSWSQHALGLAVDVNPFHNPYVRGDAVVPELASAYVDRNWHRPGMLTADDVAGFTAAGWGWGGDWRSSKDWMHLSASGG